MSAVYSLSSAALGELIGARRLFLEKNGELVLANLNLELKTKLSLMGVQKIFRFFSDTKAALHYYQWQFLGKGEKIEIQFAPELKTVPALRQLVSQIVAMRGYTSKDSFRIETIVDEICNNAIEHGMLDDLSSIKMSMEINRDKILLNVSGKSDPEKSTVLKKLVDQLQVTSNATAAETISTRGRGISLVKMLSNDFSINVDSNGTTVHVTKMKES